MRYENRNINTDHETGKLENELAFLKIRYKLPGETESHLKEIPIVKNNNENTTSDNLIREANFASAVAGFAQLLKNDKYLENWNYDDALKLAQENKGEDEYGYRSEFVQLVRKAKMGKGMEY